MQIAEAKVRGSLLYCAGCNKIHVRFGGHTLNADMAKAMDGIFIRKIKKYNLEPDFKIQISYYDSNPYETEKNFKRPAYSILFEVDYSYLDNHIKVQIYGKKEYEHNQNVCRPELRVAIGIPLQALEKAKYALMQVVKK